MTIRDDVQYEVEDDGGILFNVQKTANGTLTAEVRVYGYVVVDGKRYAYDRNIRVRLKRDKD